MHQSFPDKNCVLTLLEISPCHSVTLTSFFCYDFESLIALLLMSSISGYAVACLLCGLFRCRSVSASGLGLRIKAELLNSTGLYDEKIINRLFS